MRTRAQQWSAAAFNSVRKQGEGASIGSYRTACMKLPGLIHQSGLLQALVFTIARDAAGKQLINDVAGALAAQEKNPDHASLIRMAQNAELRSYFALTREVVEVAQWFRRFAQIELTHGSSEERDA